MPGQLYFGKAPPSIRTLLGSCVALTLWHPTRRIGGMCHYLLPERRRNPDQQRDGRYGTEALEVLVEMLLRLGTRPSEYEAHLYGGADTLPDGVTMKFNVGERNIEKGMELCDQYGLNLVAVDVGDQVPRTVTLLLPEGKVRMQRGPAAKLSGAA